MIRADHIRAIAELSESEGVFTTAQAARLGITRDALHDAVGSGRLERVVRGAYRLVGSGSAHTDEIAAIWKLTDPARFTWERMRPDAWDGVAIGGTTAASLQGIGDFFASPYRIYSPKRINSRLKAASFSVRRIGSQDVSWVRGLPLTRLERTLVDLCLDYEDPSLIADAYHDAERAGLDHARLGELVESVGGTPKRKMPLKPLTELIGNGCSPCTRRDRPISLEC